MQQAFGSLKKNLCEKKTFGAVPKAMPFAAEVYSVIRKPHPKLLIEKNSLSTHQIEIHLNDFSIDAGVTYCKEA